VTTGIAILFMCTSLGLTYFSSRQGTATIFDDAPEATAPAAPAAQPNVLPEPDAAQPDTAEPEAAAPGAAAAAGAADDRAAVADPAPALPEQ